MARQCSWIRNGNAGKCQNTLTFWRYALPQLGVFVILYYFTRDFLFSFGLALIIVVIGFGIIAHRKCRE